MSEEIRNAAIRVKVAREEFWHAAESLRTAEGWALVVASAAYERAAEVRHDDERFLSSLILEQLESEAAPCLC